MFFEVDFWRLPMFGTIVAQDVPMFFPSLATAFANLGSTFETPRESLADDILTGSFWEDFWNENKFDRFCRIFAGHAHVRFCRSFPSVPPAGPVSLLENGNGKRIGSGRVTWNGCTTGIGNNSGNMCSCSSAANH